MSLIRPRQIVGTGNSRSVSYNDFMNAYNAAQRAYRFGRQAYDVANNVYRRYRNNVESNRPRDESRRRRPGPPGPVGGRIKIVGEKGTSRAVTVKTGKKKKQKKPYVKVPKTLRKQINTVISDKEIKGTYHTNSFAVLGLPPSNEQGVIPANDNFYGAQNVFSSFSALHYLHAASVLWAEIQDTQPLSTLEGCIGVTNGPGDDIMIPPDALSSHACTARIRVINSWEKYLLKNNSPRQVTVTIYECIPKKAIFENNTGFTTGNLTITGQPLYHSNPVQHWVSALASEHKATGNKSNIAASMLHLDPRSCKTFKALYNVEATNIVLEPGQTYNHFVQGPKNMMMDFSKFYSTPVGTNEGSLQPVRTFSKCLMFVLKVDLVTQGNNNAGRLASVQSETVADVICVEKQFHCKLACPETVGAKIDNLIGGTKNIDMHRKYPKYFYRTITTSGTGAPMRVDEQNPEDL